jgi:hypothetical protein
MSPAQWRIRGSCEARRGRYTGLHARTLSNREAGVRRGWFAGAGRSRDSGRDARTTGTKLGRPGAELACGRDARTTEAGFESHRYDVPWYCWLLTLGVVLNGYL